MIPLEINQWIIPIYFPKGGINMPLIEQNKILPFKVFNKCQTKASLIIIKSDGTFWGKHIYRFNRMIYDNFQFCSCARPSLSMLEILNYCGKFGDYADHKDYPLSRNSRHAELFRGRGIKRR